MIKIGIICPSEIAFRRFLPALNICGEYQYIGVAIANKREWFGTDCDEVSSNTYDEIKKVELAKAENFQNKYGGKIFESYESLINCPEIDAVYLPLPPALHFKWAKRALDNGKHVFVEKPSTTSPTDTQSLISIARDKKLAIHENYMFVFHSQLKQIKNILDQGDLGEIRSYRIDFGFPKRADNDFRYSKKLGGGALLDCGGYALKYADMLLGGYEKIEYAKLNYTDKYDVDIYGSAAISNAEGQVVQISFGMDNAYKCDLEVWGSKGRLLSERILTAPVGFNPKCTLITTEGFYEKVLLSDDTFQKSLLYFAECIKNENTRLKSYSNIQKQANLVDEFLEKAGK